MENTGVKIILKEFYEQKQKPLLNSYISKFLIKSLVWLQHKDVFSTPPLEENIFFYFLRQTE